MAGVLGYSKNSKMYIEGAPFRFQEDNVLLEFDIDPASNFVTFNSYISKAIESAKEIASGHGMSIGKMCSHIYSEEELANFAQSAFVFGCDADYNVLTGRKNRIPRASAGLRSAGGHVHLGFDISDDFGDKFVETQMNVGIACDYFLGLHSIMEDSDKRRREIYGKAGAVRFKDYGIEYRTLSNYWIFSDEKRKAIYLRSQSAVEYGRSKDKMASLFAICPPEVVQEVINNGDVDMAETILEKMGEL
ncbi:COOH.NH2 ligase [Vibrio phage Vp_R1]|uniref:Uncharacterized protein n=1 Tax=Vibrio phage Vp_R1 TaxID=2059867 RepID=A0A2H5BQ27_9CAUD|nr:COOH.NH2 ligase [Vibrio phage Vp_R1]AUG88434.1 hypothetical protein VPR_070 [Vibrio phage Vp_R1]